MCVMSLSIRKEAPAEVPIGEWLDLFVYSDRIFGCGFCITGNPGVITGG